MATSLGTRPGTYVADNGALLSAVIDAQITADGTPKPRALVSQGDVVCDLSRHATKPCLYRLQLREGHRTIALSSVTLISLANWRDRSEIS